MTDDGTSANHDAPRKAEPFGPADPAGDAAVPRLPRGRGLRLSGPELLRVAGLAILLVFLVLIQRPCADAVATFVTSFGDQGSAGSATPRPGPVDLRGSGAAPGSAAAASTAVPGAFGSPSAGSGAAADDPGLDGYERLRPGMTDDEIKAVIDRARAKAAGRKIGP